MNGVPGMYSEKETIDKIQNAMKNGVNKLYKAKCVNWIGVSNDSPPKPYVEIIAKELINKHYVGKLARWAAVKRTEYYSPNRRRIMINVDSNRKEENVAKVLFALFSDKSRRTLGELGNIFDHQVPLRKVKNDEAGKIDLVSYDQEKQKIWLIEMKNKENHETLLRCILEIATYYQILNKPSFVKDYELLEMDHAAVDSIHKAVLVFEDSSQSSDLEEMKKGNRPQLEKLSKLLDIEFFLLNINNQVKRVF